MMLLLFGAVQLARVFYVYHGLQKAVRGGAVLLARSRNVDYCTAGDLALQDARNFIVYGNLQGQGQPIVQGLTPDLIQVFPERVQPGSTGVMACACNDDPQDPANCNIAAGARGPDFVVINFGSGFPLAIPFAFMNVSSVNLRVSVRMPVIGG
jgi:hypothetical protein